MGVMRLPPALCPPRNDVCLAWSLRHVSRSPSSRANRHASACLQRANTPVIYKGLVDTCQGILPPFVNSSVCTQKF